MSSAKPVSAFVNALIDDEKFLNLIKENIDNITEDGKITVGDIPEILTIVTECYNNMSKFKLTYEELPDVLIELTNYIIEHFELIPDDEEEEFKKMIDTAVKLVMLQPKIKKGCLKLWSKIKNMSCCKK